MKKAIKHILLGTVFATLLSGTAVFAADDKPIDPPIGLQSNVELRSGGGTIDPPIGSPIMMRSTSRTVDPPIIKPSFID